MWKVREDVEKYVSVSQRIDWGVQRWLGHVERMRDERMAKSVYEGEEGLESVGWIE